MNMILDILSGDAGHHAEVYGRARLLRQNIRRRAAAEHSYAGGGSYHTCGGRNLLHNRLHKRLQCGQIAGDARKNIEEETGKPVITSKNATQLNDAVVGLIENIIDIESENDNENGE